ncbi:hypothetical protein [Comamonas sp. JC664]|uniref:hypothetical protein n=1 Tax=Comamonas sp. JC664 TaxID=2801917 RepID=UPI00360E79ED
MDKLEQVLAPLGREPHSVIGSSCIGASVLGGICNNSGGSLVRRGPAYTELALYAQVRADGSLAWSTPGHCAGDSPQEILTRLHNGDYREADITHDAQRAASDRATPPPVRDVDQDSPARFNADPSRLFEASGSAGKLCLFAVRSILFRKCPAPSSISAAMRPTT